MRFGEQRTLAGHYGAAKRLLYRLMGVADPAHYLHARYLRRALPLLAADPRAILDAGCGSGDFTFYLARRFPGATVLGVDVDAALITRNRRVAAELGLQNVRFEVQDLAEASGSDSFDLVVAIDVLEHIHAQQKALRAIAEQLRPSGIAFLHIPVRRSRPVPLDRHLGAFHEWAAHEHVSQDKGPAEFAEAVASSGLMVERVEHTFGYWTGELATSLFALGYADTPRDRLLQALLAPLCRALALGDTLGLDRTRFAVAVVARKPARLARTRAMTSPDTATGSADRSSES